MTDGYYLTCPRHCEERVARRGNLEVIVATLWAVRCFYPDTVRTFFKSR